MIEARVITKNNKFDDNEDREYGKVRVNEKKKERVGPSQQHRSTSWPSESHVQDSPQKKRVFQQNQVRNNEHSKKEQKFSLISTLVVGTLRVSFFHCNQDVDREDCLLSNFHKLNMKKEISFSECDRDKKKIERERWYICNIRDEDTEDSHICIF